MKGVKLVVVLGVILPLMVTACMTSNPPATATALSGHPVSMGAQDCIDCHRAATPQQVQQWEQSAHGFAMVNCQVCHGDANNFSSIPANENCRSCHAAEVANNASKPGTNCATCHIAHNFTVHRVHQYK